ncbi:MAG: hypothetical protein ACKOXB_04725 [Flavobacteriales bacterium]
MRLLVPILLLMLFIASCAEPEDCERINKTSDCLPYNNCNILENWKLNKVEKQYTSAQDTFTKPYLKQDLLLVYADGSLQLRLDNILSPLDRWSFASCQELKLSSSASDTTLTLRINKMEAEAMQWEYTSTETDSIATWKVVNTFYYSRL